MKTFRSRETVEAALFEWPDEKPVTKGDTFHGYPVHMDTEGAHVATRYGAVRPGDYLFRQHGEVLRLAAEEFDRRYAPEEEA